MLPSFHKGNIYIKRKLRVCRDQKCIPLVGAITPLNCAGHENTPYRGRQYQAQNGKFGKLGRTYGHGTVFAPRKYLYHKKLRVWRDQKCIPLVGAITRLPVPAVKIPRREGGSIGPRIESCVNCDGPISMVPCLHQGNIYTERKLRVWRDQKCIRLVGAITPLNCEGRQNTPSRGRQYRAEN